MFLKMSNTTHTVLINIYIILSKINSGLATSVCAFLINNKNNGNNYKKDQKDCTLVVRYQEIIRRSVSLFLIKNIYKHIRSIHLQLNCYISFILNFARTTSSNTSMICISTNIFIISLNKKLAYTFLFFKSNIYQHLNQLNYEQKHPYYSNLYQHFYYPPK